MAKKSTAKAPPKSGAKASTGIKSVKTSNMEASNKLQKAGASVVSVTGDGKTFPKTHCLKVSSSIVKLAELTKDELADVK